MVICAQDVSRAKNTVEIGIANLPGSMLAIPLSFSKAHGLIEGWFAIAVDSASMRRRQGELAIETDIRIAFHEEDCSFIHALSIETSFAIVVAV